MVTVAQKDFNLATVRCVQIYQSHRRPHHWHVGSEFMRIFEMNALPVKSITMQRVTPGEVIDMMKMPQVTTIAGFPVDVIGSGAFAKLFDEQNNLLEEIQITQEKN